MSIRTILASASGGTASAGALELACQLAHRLPAHVEGFHVVPDLRRALGDEDSGDDLKASAGLVDQVMSDAAAKAARVKASFETIAARYQLPHRTLSRLNVPRERGPSACWREEAGSAPALVPRRARFFDLVVLGRSDRMIGEPYTDTIEQAIMRSGRPVLVAPAHAPSGIGYVVALAWNGSPQAVRATTAALPFLAVANAVNVITIGDSDPAGVQALLDYLAWHGISATHRDVPATHGRRTGEVLLDAARETAADLLVMGGYGHGPWREFLFGGVTREAVGRSLMPLLLMH